MFTTAMLAAAEEPSRGWGGPIALGIVIVIWVTGATVHDWWMRTHPSPTPDGNAGVGDTPQVSAVSDTGDTDRDTAPDTGWWGRIVETGGRRHRVYDQVVDDQADEAAEPEEETIEDVIDDLDRRGVPYVEIVPQLMAQYRISDSTAKRRIRAARESREEREPAS